MVLRYETAFVIKVELNWRNDVSVFNKVVWCVALRDDKQDDQTPTVALYFELRIFPGPLRVI